VATLTAPAAARAAAKERGLDLPSARTQKHQAWAAQRREHQQIAREHLWPLLSEVFPEVFRLPPPPLAIGIHKQILEVAGDSIDATELGAFLRYWTRRWSYLIAVERGEPRRNLDGTIASEPTIDQRNDAARKLWGDRAQQVAAAPKASEIAAPPP
jgi:sRNA-binding protein